MWATERVFTVVAVVGLVSWAGPARAEVVIEGERDDAPRPSRRDPTAASTQVRGEALQQPGRTSADVLERVPGVQVSRTGARSDLATASVRGASASQTPVYLGGIRLNDDVTGTADLSTVPLWMLDRVEVFRGNAPVDADRLSLGGAVFFEPRLPSRSEVSGGAEVGSFGYRAGWLLASVGQREDDATALVGYRHEGAANDYPFLDDRGTRFDSSDDVELRRRNGDHASHDLWAIGRQHIASGRGRILTLVNAYDREQGVTGLSVIPAGDSRARVRRLLAAVSSLTPCTAGTSTCQLELTSSLLSARSTLSDPRRELSLGTTHSASRGTRFTQRVRVHGELGSELSLTTGGEQAVELLAIDNSESSSLRARRATSRGAATLSWAPSRSISLHALGAVECHSTAGPQGNETCGVLEPLGRVGPRIELVEGIFLLGNVGRYVRVPTLAELYGISPLVRGAEDLDPETGVSADVGVQGEVGGAERTSPSVRFDGFLFWREARDLIAYRQSSLGVIRPFNVGSAQLYGAEAAVAARFFDAVLLEGSAAALEPKDTTEGRTLVNDVLPFRSKLTATGRLEAYTKSSAVRLDRAGLAAVVRHRASRFADAAGLIVIPATTLYDLELSTTWLSQRLRVQGQIRNILDDRNFDTVGLPLPGRSLFAGAQLTLP